MTRNTLLGLSPAILLTVCLPGIACTAVLSGPQDESANANDESAEVNDESAVEDDSGNNSGGGGAPPGTGGMSTGGEPLPPEECELRTGNFVPYSLLRRMTPAQYDRTVGKILGEVRNFGETFPTPTREHGYDNQASSQHVQRQEVEKWEQAAQDISLPALDTAPALAHCSVESSEFENCFRGAFPQLAQELLRSPLSAEDEARYGSFFEARMAESGAVRAAQLTLQALLLAPRFLFQVEEGILVDDADPDLRELNAFELVSRLAFAFHNEAPDAALLEEAAAGQVETPQQVVETIVSMIEDERSLNGVVDFHSQWIDLAEVDNMVLPENVSESVKTSAKHEVQWMIEDWYQETPALVGELFTSTRTWLDPDLASYYGVESEETGPASLPETERAGLLTRAVFLGTHTIPPTRGDYILERVLCLPVPALVIVPPPAPDLGPTATTRERFEQHSEDPCAASCHGVIDPIGFAFEHYDAAGQFRTEENGRVVDASTELPFEPETGVSGSVDNAIDLSNKIAESPMAQDCMVENWFRYLQGRGAVAADRCSLWEGQRAMQDSNGNLRALLEAMANTDAFRFIRKDYQ